MSTPVVLPIVESLPPRLPNIRTHILEPRQQHARQLLYPIRRQRNRARAQPQRSPLKTEGQGASRRLQGKSVGDGEPIWLAGLTLGILACCFNALGMALQKKAHKEERKCLTWVGVGLMAVAGLLDFASFGFAAQSLLAPVGTLTLVANAFVARCLLGERMALKGYFATIVIVGGCAVSVGGASHDTRVHTAAQLVAFLSRTEVIVYFVFVVAIVAVAGLVLFAIEYDGRGLQLQGAVKLDDEGFETPAVRCGDAGCETFVERGCGMAASMCPAAGDRQEIRASNDGAPIVAPGQFRSSPEPDSEEAPCGPWCQQLHGVLHGLLAGIIGAQSLVFGKASAEMFVAMIHHGDSFSPGPFLLALFFMVCTLVGQLWFLNRGLKHHLTLLVVPVYQTFWTLAGVVGGAMCYNEFDTASGLKMLMFMLGVFAMLFGLWFLVKSQGTAESTPPSEASSPRKSREKDPEIGLAYHVEDATAAGSNSAGGG